MLSFDGKRLTEDGRSNEFEPLLLLLLRHRRVPRLPLWTRHMLQHIWILLLWLFRYRLHRQSVWSRYVFPVMFCSYSLTVDHDKYSSTMMKRVINQNNVDNKSISKVSCVHLFYKVSIATSVQRHSQCSNGGFICKTSLTWCFRNTLIELVS